LLQKRPFSDVNDEEYDDEDEIVQKR
jgi:hypothetical protein